MLFPLSPRLGAWPSIVWRHQHRRPLRSAQYHASSYRNSTPDLSTRDSSLARQSSLLLAGLEGRPQSTTRSSSVIPMFPSPWSERRILSWRRPILLRTMFYIRHQVRSQLQIGSLYLRQELVLYLCKLFRIPCQARDQPQSRSPISRSEPPPQLSRATEEKQVNCRKHQGWILPLARAAKHTRVDSQRQSVI